MEEEAIDYGYEPKEATGRTAGQLRKMISEARAATKAAKDADRKRRESPECDCDACKRKHFAFCPRVMCIQSFRPGIARRS